MSKKKLLSESQIRRFMGLAGINSLTDSFISRGTPTSVLQEQAPLEDEDEMAMGAEDEDAAPVGDEMDMDEPAPEPMDEPASELSVADVEAALADALMAMESELEEALPGVQLSVEKDEEAPVEEPMDDLPAEEPMGDEMAMGAEEPEEAGMGMSGMYEDVSSSVEIVDTEAIVQEVYRRVAKRLNQMVKNNKK